MMIVLLLLGAFVCNGLSFDDNRVVDYGESFLYRLRGTVDSIEFIPKHSSNVTILWKKGDPIMTRNRQHIMVGSYYQIKRVTQENSGRYISRDENKKQLSVYTLEVRANTRTYQRKPGSSLRFFYNLATNFCNIRFFPKNSIQPGVLKKDIIRQGKLQGDLDSLDCVKYELFEPCGISFTGLQMSCGGRYEIRDQNDNAALEVLLEMQEITMNVIRKTGERLNLTLDLAPHACNIYFYPDSDPTDRVEIVRKGRLHDYSMEIECAGFALFRPCGIQNDMLQMSCKGRYEIRDQNDNMAVVLYMDVEESPHDEPSYIGIGVSAFLVSLCCGCIKRCCCGKSSSKEDKAETPAAEPDIQEYDHEPVRPGRDQQSQPSETNYPAQPSYTPNAPLIHVHPTVTLPPAYSEIHDYPSVSLPPPYSEAEAPAEQAEQAEAPTVPVQCDPGPQFELRGVTFPSAPLSSDSALCEVYSSDKFNFKHL